MPLITVRDLQGIGRFGNQLFLYVFAKGYAQKMGCELQTQDWVGRSLFVNATEPLVNVQLPQTEVENCSSKAIGYFFGQRDIDLKVFAQHQRYLDYFTRLQAKEWLRLKPEFEQYAPGGSYSACHLRRGDYVSDPFLRQNYCEVSEGSYRKALERFKIPEPVRMVTEGWKAPAPALETRGMGWLEDFLTLRNAAYLLRGNSSFSVWASWLGEGKVYAPVVGRMTGLKDVTFVEGNWPCTAGRFRNQSDLHLKEV